MQHLFCPLSTTFFVYIYISQLAIRNCISILSFSAPSLMQHKTEPNSCTGIASSREGSYFIAFWWPTQTQIGLSITKLKEFSSSSYSLSFSASSCGLQSLDSHKTLIRSFSPQLLAPIICLQREFRQQNLAPLPFRFMSGRCLSLSSSLTLKVQTD